MNTPKDFALSVLKDSKAVQSGYPKNIEILCFCYDNPYIKTPRPELCQRCIWWADYHKEMAEELRRRNGQLVV